MMLDHSNIRKSKLIISISHHTSSLRHSVPIRACMKDAATTTVFALNYDPANQTLKSPIKLFGVKNFKKGNYDSVECFLNFIKSIRMNFDEIYFFSDINLGSKGPVVSDLFQRIVETLNNGAEGESFLSYVGAYSGDEISLELSDAFINTRLTEMYPRTVFKLTSTGGVVEEINLFQENIYSNMTSTQVNSFSSLQEIDEESPAPIVMPKQSKAINILSHKQKNSISPMTTQENDDVVNNMNSYNVPSYTRPKKTFYCCSIKGKKLPHAFIFFKKRIKKIKTLPEDDSVLISSANNLKSKV